MILTIDQSAREWLTKVLKPPADWIGGVQHLKVSVSSGGCNGFSYHLQITDNIEGLTVIDNLIAIDKKSLLFLDGATLSYKTDFLSGGLIIINPNAKSTCGCGESFSV